MLGESLHHALHAFGYVEGQNLILERRSAEGQFSGYDDIIAELVRLKTDVIVTSPSPMVQQARLASITVPIRSNSRRLSGYK